MSTSREEVVRSIEQGNFSLFAKVEEKDYVTVANFIEDCFVKDFLRSSYPEQWIKFLQYLNSTPQRILKMPSHLIAICRKVITSPHRSPENDELCTQLFLTTIDELERDKNLSLDGNELYLISNMLAFKETHLRLLHLIETMADKANTKALRCLLEQYIARPELLYRMYRFPEYKNKRDQFFSQLVGCTNDPEKIFFILELKKQFQKSKTTTEEEKMKLLCEFLCDRETNQFPVKDLSNQDKELYLKLKIISTGAKKLLARLESLISENEQASENLAKLSESTDLKSILDFTNEIGKFFDPLNQLAHHQAQGLLTCAQLASRKKHFQNLVVFADGKMDEFLKALRSSKTPIRLQFIQTGSHWVAGVIEIDADGLLRVAIFDSLGGKIKTTPSGINSTTLDIMRAICNAFPTAVIYFSEPRTQTSYSGCSVYALDNVKHIFNIEKILDKNLFEFLAQQQQPLTELHHDKSLIKFYRCGLPLSLLRTAQTGEYYLRFKGSEQQQIVNKKGQTFFQSTERFFNPDPRSEHEIRNTRIDHEQIKMGKYNAIYKLTHSEETIMQDTKKFTLEHFIDECGVKNDSGALTPKQKQH